jgi:hypothetical protein
MDTNKPVRRFATVAQRIAVYELMKDHVTVVGNGVCVYEKGWDDDTIATAIKVKATSVAHVRKEMFGRLYVTSPQIELPLSSVQERVTTLERLVAHLFQSLGAEPPKGP